MELKKTDEEKWDEIRRAYARNIRHMKKIKESYNIILRTYEKYDKNIQAAISNQDMNEASLLFGKCYKSIRHKVYNSAGLLNYYIEDGHEEICDDNK
jgi:hypothetical protein